MLGVAGGRAAAVGTEAGDCHNEREGCRKRVGGVYGGSEALASLWKPMVLRTAKGSVLGVDLGDLFFFLCALRSFLVSTDAPRAAEALVHSLASGDAGAGVASSDGPALGFKLVSWANTDSPASKILFQTPRKMPFQKRREQPYIPTATNIHQSIERRTNTQLATRVVQQRHRPQSALRNRFSP